MVDTTRNQPARGAGWMGRLHAASALTEAYAAFVMRLDQVLRTPAPKTASTTPNTMPQAEPAREPGPDRSPEAHLTRLSAVIETTATRGLNAQRCHDRAGQRIDAALYELDQLRQSLQTVIDPALLDRGGSPVIASSASDHVAPAGEPNATADQARAARSAA